MCDRWATEMKFENDDMLENKRNVENMLKMWDETE